MKRILKSLLLAVSVITLATYTTSCTETDGTVATPSEERAVSITVSTPQTRVAVDGNYNVTWTDGDDVSLLPLNGVYDQRTQLTVDVIATDGESATFVGTTESAATSFRLVHPYSATDQYEDTTIDDVTFPSYICTLDIQDAGFTKTYMVSSESVSSIYDAATATMMHVGAIIILNTTFIGAEELIGSSTLTSISVNSPDNKYYYKNRINLVEEGMVMTDATEGISVINVGETVAQTMSVGFNVFPFSLTESQSLTITYTFTDGAGETTSYDYSLTGHEFAIERATYNIFNITVNLGGDDVTFDDIINGWNDGVSSGGSMI